MARKPAASVSVSRAPPILLVEGKEGYKPNQRKEGGGKQWDPSFAVIRHMHTSLYITIQYTNRRSVRAQIKPSMYDDTSSAA